MDERTDEEKSNDAAYRRGRNDGRLDAQFSGRVSALEGRMEKLEKELVPQMAGMSRLLEALVADSKMSKTRWEWWWDVGARVMATLYRSAVLLMFMAVFARNSELGKTLAPWIGKVFFP